MLRLTSPESAALDATAVGLIALGAVEQHGPHLPLGTDALIARALAHRVAEQLAFPVVLVPSPVGGLSDHHAAFAGTVTLSAETLSAVLDDLVAALERMGVHRVALFSAHGGNFEFLRGYAETRHVEAFSDLPTWFSTCADAARGAGLTVGAADEHAGLLETSQALDLFEELVGDFSSVVGFAGGIPGWHQRLWDEGIGALSPLGVMGDPRLASAVAGAAINAALTRMLCAWMVSCFGPAT